MRSFHAGDYVSQGWQDSYQPNKINRNLYQNPFIDITKASKVIGQSFPTAKSLIENMVENNILSEITGGKRGKKYVLSKYIEIFMR